MKVKIIDKRGLPVGGRIIPQGETIDLAGPVLDAALRFGQAEEVKKAAATEPPAPAAAEKPEERSPAKTAKK
ncbi:hypothetical protein OpiT1DRAFT_03974 [Opitutaceae bacterium TAV1]|nr:hypothetical protein OpiT1DRAFT_03974 [Opitutaceae bacterium TAV1]